MRKYSWTVEEINKQDYFKTMEIELGDFGLDDPPTAYVDDIFGFWEESEEWIKR